MVEHPSVNVTITVQYLATDGTAPDTVTIDVTASNATEAALVLGPVLSTALAPRISYHVQGPPSMAAS